MVNIASQIMIFLQFEANRLIFFLASETKEGTLLCFHDPLHLPQTHFLDPSCFFGLTLMQMP